MVVMSVGDHPAAGDEAAALDSGMQRVKELTGIEDACEAILASFAGSPGLTSASAASPETDLITNIQRCSDYAPSAAADCYKGALLYYIYQRGAACFGPFFGCGYYCCRITSTGGTSCECTGAGQPQESSQGEILALTLQ